MRVIITLIAIIFLVSCKNKKADINIEPHNFYQLGKNRVAAEWEPAKGVMFTCPPIIPKELIVELANDTHIYPIVDGEEAKAEAKEWFLKWGIDINRVTFINLKGDYDIPYVRDWGPAGVFVNDDGFKLVDAVFINSDPFSDRACNDSLELHKSDETGLDYHSLIADSSITPLANQLDMDIFKVPFTSTGGNVLTDGIGTAFSTCILLTENRFNGVSNEQFYSLNDSLLGYNNYHVTSNFESDGIQHIDCLLKIIDEETLLVGQPPTDHELFNIYEDIVENELSTLKNPYGRPYNIQRIQLGRIVEEYLTAYTNSLILNKNVYVPLFGVKTDSMAIEIWKTIMPGYTIKGIPFVIDNQEYLVKNHFDEYKEIGANSGWAPDDALHCRTRAVWDEDMIFISVNKVPAEQSDEYEAQIYVTVKEYSDQALNELDIVTYWRIKGTDSWNTKIMTNYRTQHHWFTNVPVHENNTVIEYYIEVNSKSGDSKTRPMSAPNGFYEFKYVSQQ